MRIRLFSVGAAMIIMAIAACGPNAAPPPEPPIPSGPYGFTATAQYTIEANLQPGHRQRIVLTTGEPTTVTAWSQTHAILCAYPAPSRDMLVPVHLRVTNTTPTITEPIVVGVTLTMAVDATEHQGTLGYVFQDYQTKACRNQMPFAGVTLDPLVPGQRATTHTIVSPKNVGPGQSLEGWGYFAVSGGGKQVPPMSSVFLIVSSPPDNKEIPYAITELAAHKSVAGVVTAGALKGAFYIPLQAGASPCGAFSAGAPMHCGATLQPPR